jgi:histidyl-tRNA synthetase
VGFASGIERVVLTMDAQGCSFGREPANKVFVVAAEQETRIDVMDLVRTLRQNRISADMDYMGRSMKSQMKAAGNTAKYACIIGRDELDKKLITLKDLKEGTQEELSLEAMINKLR